ncbi:hypothetical protein PHMEG_0009956 [Phytophthora megakarya]|uniref:Uncharacterized protein n=1 Tax=Phytophthora megakarya TaxID=4795 RepID=A0A225WEW8_9STRA|nr:hypothetical protein PHMEG_0009956 [Phytophthora megakarya]
MVRPRINGQGRKLKLFQRMAVDYAHKRDVLDFQDEGHTLDAAIAHVYGDLNADQIRAKTQQINKWMKHESTIRSICKAGRLSLRARTRQGQITPEDAHEAMKAFMALVLQTYVEKKCVQIYNEYQTGKTPCVYCTV